MPGQAFLSTSLQESLLTLLAFDVTHGRQIIGQLELKHFDQPYRNIADRLIDYRTRFGNPPGVAHLDDLFDTMLESGDQANRQLTRTLLEGMLNQSRHLNPEWVASRVTQFIRRQTLKDALVRAGTRIGQGDDEADDETERILNEALKLRIERFHIGTRLGDRDKALAFLDDPDEVFPIGIPELDRLEIGPTRKQLMVYQAPRKRGKTWAMIHIGKYGIARGDRVLHISLEMGEKQITMRYFMSLFRMGNPNRTLETRLGLDEFGHIIDLQRVALLPKLNRKDPRIRQILDQRITESGTRFNNLIVRHFPSGSLTIGALESYLDYLESKEGFVPSILIVDYPQIMKQDAKNYRISIGQTYVNLRRVCEERNMAGVAPAQSNREGTFAKETDETHIGEDISIINTADLALAYSQTKAEKKLGLGRLTVTNARYAEDGFSVLLSQNYAQGQFCVASGRITDRYEETLRTYTEGSDTYNPDD